MPSRKLGGIVVKGKGLQKLTKRLNKRAMSDVMRKTANTVAAEAFGRIVEATPVRKKNGGTLKRSWTIKPAEKTKTGYSAQIGTNLYYSIYVEYGHRIVRNGVQIGYAPPKYFLRDAMDAFKPEVKKVAQKAFEGALRNAVSGKRSN